MNRGAATPSRMPVSAEMTKLMRDFDRAVEKIEKLTGERGDALKSLSALRRYELWPLASMSMVSAPASADPTSAEFNALYADVFSIFQALQRISNLYGNYPVNTSNTFSPTRPLLGLPATKSSGGSGGGGGPSPSASAMGWAQYLDTEYDSTTPFVILDGVTATLPNDAGNNITAYLPDGITEFYDPTTQKLTPAAVGDYNAITIRFTAEASATSTYLEFGIDTGNPLGPIFRDIKVFPKGAGVEHPFTFTCMGFSLNNFFTNGGIVKIKPVGGDVEVYDINYHFARLIPA